MVDWKTTIDSSEMRTRMKKCQIQSHVNDSRDMFNTTAPDIIQYLSPGYKSVIHSCVVTKMNEIFNKTKEEFRHFRGKVSVIAHSLGTVITYDVLNL